MVPSLAELSTRHPDLLQGSKRESIESLHAFETALRVILRNDVKTYLLELGYGPANAITNIVESIGDTERFRRAVNLPAPFVVLNDRNDAGAVLLDCSSPKGRGLRVDTFALGQLANGTLDIENADVFQSFAEWVAFCIEDLLDDTEA